MGSKFEAILKRVAGRQRFLNAVNATRRLLTASLMLTAIYLIAALPPSFKLLPKWELSWLILFNFVVGAVGFVSGYFQRIDLAAALYQADRKLKLGEKLCTIYDLRAQEPQSDFLSMLYQKIAHLEIDIKKLFPFSRVEKITLVSLFALGLFWALLALQYTGYIHFIGLRDRQVTAPTSQKEVESPKAPVESEDIVGLMEKLSEIRESVEALEHLQQQAAARSEAQNEAFKQAAQLLSQQLDSLQQSLLGREPSTSEPSAAVGDREKQRQRIEQLKKDLQELNEKLSQGASSDEIGELLKSIAQNTGSESFEELSEAAQAQDQERLKELSEQISNQLEEKAELGRQIEELQEKLKELMASLREERPAGKEPGEPPADKPDSEREQEAGEVSKAGPQGEGDAPKPADEQTGREPNTQAGKSGTPMPKQPSQIPPDFYKAPISGLFPSTPTSTKELPTKKAPIETEVTAQGVIYRVNYQKLEAFLQEMQDELSPEMREIIRAYFVLITASINE